MAFFISAVMLTIYVVAHFAVRYKEDDDESQGTGPTTRLVSNKIFFCKFIICFYISRFDLFVQLFLIYVLFHCQ